MNQKNYSNVPLAQQSNRFFTFKKFSSSNNQSRCIYCGSTAYGKGCRIAPHKTHIHLYNKGRCIYCGSTAYGKGCRLNPHGKEHVHGIAFHSMFTESAAISLAHFWQLLELVSQLNSSRLQNTKAYKLKLIDEKGQILKRPQTQEERVALSPLFEFLLFLYKNWPQFRNLQTLFFEQKKFASLLEEKNWDLVSNIKHQQRYKQLTNLALQLKKHRQAIKNLFSEALKIGIDPHELASL